MEDNYQLLLMVLKYHYKYRPSILDEALQLIKAYSGKDNSATQDYEDTLQILQFKMNDLPKNILTFFLSMVPLSTEQKSNNLTLGESVETDSNIRSVLLSYLEPIQNITSDKDFLMSAEFPEAGDKDVKKVATHEEKILESIKENYEKNIKRVKRNKKKQVADCKKLLDLCCEYVVGNKERLNNMYTKINHRAWMSVNSNLYAGDDLQRCYDVIKDLNKKLKWLRMIDMDEVPYDIIEEQYKNSDVLLLEHQLYDIVYEDPFIINKELEEAVSNYVNE